MVLVIAETHDGRLAPAVREAVTAARHLTDDVTVVVTGAAPPETLAALSRLPVADVIHLTHPALDPFTSEGQLAAVAPLIATLAPSHVVVAYTYQARDYVPRLAARLGCAIVTDCTALARNGDTVVFSRPIFQGKMTADVVLDGPAPHVVCVQVGAFRADALADRPAEAPIRAMVAAVDAATPRLITEPPFREARQDVDLTAATRIVAAGRGIKEEGQLGIVRQLAEALGAELAASRPICDTGWLPMDRQIGSSGQTVAPQLYVAVGISGAIQHIVGMKASKVIVAINKDADAPIFEIADYGIVGDLFEVVPALVAALEAR